MQSVFLALGTAAALCTCAAAGDYSFRTIAEHSPQFFNFGDFAISPCGEVVFIAINMSTDMAMYGATGGVGPKSMTWYVYPGDFDLLSDVDVNQDLQIVYRAVPQFGGVHGIYTQWGTLPPTSEVVTSAGPFAFFGAPVVNSSGDIAFRAKLDTSVQGVFVGSHDGVDGPIATTEGPMLYFGSTVAINDSGTIVCWGETDTGESVILISDGGAATTLYDSGGPFDFVGISAINNAGDVAFVGTLDNGGNGVFIGDGGPPLTIADDSEAFIAFNFLNLNNAGDVAFLAYMKDLSTGIFTGPDDEADRVLAVGDRFMGATVTDVYFSDKGLNDAGQIVFFAQLDDGRSGLYRADPIGFCPADIAPSDGDGFVNVDDLLTVINSWGAGAGPADINVDGTVNVNDLLTVIMNWGVCTAC